MQGTPNSNRLHIAILGRRNVGKSSLINALTGQDTALVSSQPGTTTDPVQKAMELYPLGPVVFIDTAGFDDEGELGQQRVSRTKKVIEKTDLALLVFEAGDAIGLATDDALELEFSWYDMLREANIPLIGVINKKDLLCEADMNKYLEKYRLLFKKMPFAAVSVYDKKSIDGLKNILAEEAPIAENDSFISDLIDEEDVILLVMPQDKQAPKGRLILPQSQALRDILDKGAIGISTTLDSLPKSLAMLNTAPDLVITDSQVFAQVDELIPADTPFTSFSTLMAGFKGDASLLSEGAETISKLADGDRILISEACTHHALKNDIGREKIPNMLQNYTKKKLDFDVTAGADFPHDLSSYALVVHCGACMFNRKQLMSRLRKCQIQHVPVTNYGMAIAYMRGILPRVMEVFEKKTPR